jgi:hypothetical protein
MENLIKKSLELAGFKNTEALSKIISLSPNPTVAAEVLLDCHKPITAEDFGFYWVKKYNSDKHITVSSVDELANTVTYYVYTQATKRVWYETEADYKAKKFVVEKPKSNYHYEEMKTTGYNFVEETDKIPNFLSDMSKSNAGDFYKWLEEADKYVNPKLAEFETAPENNMAF